MKALLSVLIVLPMSFNLFNFDEVTVDTEQPAEIVAVEEEIVEPEISFEEMDVDSRAALVGLSTQEFITISNIVERESNRNIPQTQEDYRGRIMIALVVFNRASERHPEFGNDIISVITQPGQFSTSRQSRDVNQSTYRTEYSDRAVYEAYQWIHSGQVYPDVLFFNCRSFFRWRTPYNPDLDNNGIPDGALGGNYFSL